MAEASTPPLQVFVQELRANGATDPVAAAFVELAQEAQEATDALARSEAKLAEAQAKVQILTQQLLSRAPAHLPGRGSLTRDEVPAPVRTVRRYTKGNQTFYGVPPDPPTRLPNSGRLQHTPVPLIKGRQNATDKPSAETSVTSSGARRRQRYRPATQGELLHRTPQILENERALVAARAEHHALARQIPAHPHLTHLCALLLGMLLSTLYLHLFWGASACPPLS